MAPQGWGQATGTQSHMQLHSQSRRIFRDVAFIATCFTTKSVKQRSYVVHSQYLMQQRFYRFLEEEMYGIYEVHVIALFIPPGVLVILPAM